MTRSRRALSAMLLALASCQTDPRPPTVVGDGAHGVGGAVGGNGQTSSPGSVACTDSASCRAEALAAVARLGSPEASVRSAECVDDTCQTVLEVGDSCHPLDGLSDGTSYDCALSAAEIIAAHRAEQDAQQGQGAVDEDSLYVAGTRGFVELALSHDAWGAYDADPTFSVAAQFFDGAGEARTSGEPLDPLEGLDDCGVFAAGHGGTAGSLNFFPVDGAELSGESGRYPLRATAASHAGFWSYAGDLTSARPSFGETYRFSAQGGSLGAPIDVPVTLPTDLAVRSLDGVTSVPADDLHLQWSGTGAAPLRLQLWIDAKLSDSGSSYLIACLMKDDGEFVIPGTVLQAAPAGIATATFSRTVRNVEASGDQRLLSVGRVSTTHRFALAPVAVDSAVRDACLAHQVYLVGVYSACANLYPPNQAVTCPDYLAQASGACASYFSCRTEHVRCTPTGLTSDAVCSCP